MDKRIKILYVTDGLGNGGKERQLIETIKYLDRSKYSAGILTFNDNQHYTQTAREATDFFEIIVKDKSTIEPFIPVFRVYERFNPDITHSFDLLSSSYTYLPSRLYKSFIVNASIQDVGLDKGVQRKLKMYLISKSDVCIGNSHKGLDSYDTAGEVLYNFIDMSRFRKRMQAEKFDVIMVANFTKYKDYKSYIALVKELLDKNIIDTAYAVGDGENLSELKLITENFKDEVKQRIVFTGNVSNVEEILSTKSIGILFSTEEYGEGISNSVLEYMASGVIAISSDIGASEEIIENGMNGFLVNKGSTGEIVSIISKIKNDTSYAESIRQNAYKTIAEKFSIEKNIKTLENIYNKLVISRVE